jgi:hypothetical protein
LIAQKIHEELICRIPDCKNLHVTRDEKQAKYWFTFINKLSNHDMDMWQQACATLLHTFPTLASHCNFIFTDE